MKIKLTTEVSAPKNTNLNCHQANLLDAVIIALFFRSFRHIEVVNNIFMGIRPVVVALIAVPVFNVARSAKLSWMTAWIPVLSALLIVQFGVSPIYVIIVAGVAGFIYGRVGRGRV